MSHPKFLPLADRQVFLAEYQVRRGISLNDAPNRRIASLELLDEEDPISDEPTPETPPAQPVADAATPQLSPPAPEAQPVVPPAEASMGGGEDKLDVLAKLAKAQQAQFTELEVKVNGLIGNLDTTTSQTTGQVKALADRLDAVNGQVKRLTPLSPLEQLKSMATLSGGVSMEDYFNEWAQKHGDPTRVGPNGMYQAAENPDGKTETYYVDLAKVPDMSADAARRSLGLDGFPAY